MKRFSIYTLLFAGALLTSAGLVQAQSMETTRSVTVSGEGRIQVEPDMATLRFAIVTRADDPETARQENATASRNALNAARNLGIEERKIRLEQLRLQPAREYDQATRRYNEVGFEVSRDLVIEVVNLDQLPTLVAQLVQEGANRLSGVTYDLQDREAAKHAALRQAVEHAKVKATLMAEALQTEIGMVLRINEQGVHAPPPVRMQVTADAAMMKAEAAPEPEAYAAGELEVTAHVTITFALN